MSLKHIEQFLKGTNLDKCVAVVVGGTSGIGQGIAIKLASLNAKVIIAGRNAEALAPMNDKIDEFYPKAPKIEFKKVDLLEFADINRFTSDLNNSLPKIDYLILTAGIMRMGGRQDTLSGLDDKMTVHYYSKVVVIKNLIPLLQRSFGAVAVIKNLIPLLQRSFGAGNHPKVLSVFAAGLGRMVDKNDLDLKHCYSLKNAADACSLYNDLMVQELAKEYENVSFIHARPGVIDTPLILKGMPWYIKPTYYLLKPFMRSPDNCASFMVHGMLNAKFPGWQLLNEHGEQIEKCKDHTDENSSLVWNHTCQILGEKLK
ncbi:NAD(P)-binding domain-containing protein [Rozella allomycis CSF55]|uniref:NAD(P)-binding domain-containing protein n=1 Tax=Rozella allomycis (strain CSF55) TaxID=988480 RepID=A0A075B4I7_ROZAC|nr:NAD(P)-binding domain-containing protein [Rozella allomycis CSF55]|eukprot:EPZ36387.1 NAD(P)-binding domain-containing protein [Rozella allomycis CSF55]